LLPCSDRRCRRRPPATCEHKVIIWDGQEFGCALGKPRLRRRALALRAMPVAAGVVGDDCVVPKHLAITGATPNLLLTSATDLPLDRLMRQNHVLAPCRALHNAHARSSNPHRSHPRLSKAGRFRARKHSSVQGRHPKPSHKRLFTTLRNHKPVHGWLTAELAKSKNMVTRPRQRLWVRRERAAIRIAPSTKPTMLIAEKINLL
jgi:hypothetical protein